MRTSLALAAVLVSVLTLCACGGGGSGGGSGGGGGNSGPVPVLIVTTILPGGQTGNAYNAQITTQDGSGSGYAWSIVSGSLPGGLTLNSGTPNATITGTPSASGTFNFTVEVQDSGSSSSDTQMLTITVGAQVTIVTNLSAQVTINTPISATINTSGGSGTGYVWTITAGSLPAGVNLIQGSPNATISGTPTVGGLYTFTLQVVDPAGGNDSMPGSISVILPAPPPPPPPPPFGISTASLPNGTVGVSYSTPVSAANGTQPYTWSVSAGSLPPGLMLTSGTPDATISGTPTSAGSFSFSLMVQDNASAQYTRPFTLLINPPPPLTITTTSLPNGMVSTPYWQPISASGGTQPYSWSIISGTLGYGLSLGQGTPDAIISGTPHATANMFFTLEVTDSASATAQVSLSIHVATSTTLVIPPATLDNAVEGFYYTFRILAEGGSGTASWQIVSGALPAGLALYGTGLRADIAGTPTTSGSFSFELEVSSGTSLTATQQFSLIVNSVTGPLVIVNQKLGPYGLNFSMSTQLVDAGGTGTGQVWSFATGSQVPPGITISQSGGSASLSGIPTQLGTYNLTLEVTDSGAGVATRSYTISIEEYPTCFGQMVGQSTVFLLDCGGSMSGSRIATLRAEVTGAISDLPSTASFDCIAFGSQFSGTGYVKFMWGSLLPATTSFVSAAVSWVNGPSTNPGSGKPTYAVLQQACQVYPSSLECMVLITSSLPNTTGSSTQILADFPAWFSRYSNCKVHCVHLGSPNTSMQVFMEALALQGNGNYVAA